MADSPARRDRSLALLDLGAALAEEELRVAGAKPRRLQFSGLDALTAGELRSRADRRGKS